LAGAALVVLGIMAATGCDSGSAMQIQAQQERIYALESANSQLDADLRAARMASDAARNRAMELESDLAAARLALADQPEPVPTELPNWQGGGAIVWTDVANDILFDSGQIILKNAGKQRLQEIVSQIQANFPDRIIWVVGHTDNDPIVRTKRLYKDNLDLSLNRGYVVAKELRGLGIEPKQLVAGGQGQSNPIAPNDTKSNKSMNRRVQILAIARPSGDQG
jgi:flagellar motor protein MotB